ncbi:hypothetical protein [Streptomyces murinus]|uniref:hypothetical protein n=1 Tax=Streptomyces murinus TaxID=33900 RepID=UPI0038062C06
MRTHHDCDHRSPRRICRVCGREYKLSRAGYLPKHWARDDDGNAAPGLPNCLGAGMSPARKPKEPS